MKGRLIFLGLMCASPWVYAGAIILLAPEQFTGFGALPFFALYWAKDWGLMTPKERKELVSRDEPYWKMPLYILAGVTGVAIAVVLLSSAARLRQSLGDTVLTSAGVLFVALLFLWDLRGAYFNVKST